MKLEFAQGYIELNEDNTISLIGDYAHTFYFNFMKVMRENNQTMEQSKVMLIETIKELYEQQ